MVRKCAVAHCLSTDTTILSHRFPRNPTKAEVWKNILNIKNIPVKDLIVKYIVCTLHFEKSDYRNEVSSHLNSTAIPKIKNSSGMQFINIMEEDMMINDTETDAVDDDVDTNTNRINMFEEEYSSEDCTIINVDANKYKRTLDDIDIESSSHEKNYAYKKQKRTYSLKKTMPEKVTPITAVTVDVDTKLEGLDNLPEDDILPEDIVSSKITSIDLEIQNEKNISIPIVYESEDEILCEDEGEYADVPRKDLIKKLVESDERIKELETKLETIQKAQAEMVKSMESFKKLLKSGF